MEITCGVCHKEMTRENSKLAPEYFLCDECAISAGVAQVAEHDSRKVEDAVSSTVAGSKFEQVSRCCK